MPDYFKNFGASTPRVLQWATIFGKTIAPEEIEAAAGEKQTHEAENTPPPKRPNRTPETTDEWKAKVDLKTYQKGKRIGAGKFGETFLYQSQTPGAPQVVVKKPLAKTGLEDLRNEERLYEVVGDHPNIVKSMGMHKIEGEDCLVLEAIKGKKMSDTFDTLKKGYKEGKVSHEQFVGAMQFSIKQMLQAAAHLESKGVVHNDIAADNMMCDEETGEVKLFDFGVGVKEGEATQKAAWFKGIVSPEFATELISDIEKGGVGAGKPTAKHDVFAIGANAYEMSENQRFEYKIDDYAADLKRNLGDEAFKQRFPHIQKVVDDDKHVENLPVNVIRDFGKVGRNKQSLEALDIKSDADASEEDITKETVTRFARRNDGDDGVVKSDEDIDVPSRKKKVGKYAAMTALPSFIIGLMHPDPAQRPTATLALKHPFLKDSILDDDAARDVVANNSRTAPQQPAAAGPAAGNAAAPPVASAQAANTAAPTTVGAPTTTAGQTTATTSAVNEGANATAQTSARAAPPQQPVAATSQVPVDAAGTNDIADADQGNPLRDDSLRDDEPAQGRHDYTSGRQTSGQGYTSPTSGTPIIDNDPSENSDEQDTGPVDYDSEPEDDEDSADEYDSDEDDDDTK